MIQQAYHYGGLAIWRLVHDETLARYNTNKLVRFGHVWFVVHVVLVVVAKGLLAVPLECCENSCACRKSTEGVPIEPELGKRGHLAIYPSFEQAIYLSLTD